MRVWGFPRWLSCKEPASQAGDTGSVPGKGQSPGEGSGHPSLVFLPGKSHRQRSLAGYCPWGLKGVEHDLATEQQQNEGLGSQRVRHG